MTQLAASNTDSISKTDRSAGGNQPDNSTPTGILPSGSPGSGTVTNIATGTGLTGGPITSTGTIAANVGSSSTLGVVKVDGTTITASGGVISSVGGLPAGGTKYARLAKNSTTNYDVGWYGPSIFNVADYGAVPNSSGAASANATAIAAALAAVISNGGGCLYFPGVGTWYTNARLTVSSSVSFAILGDSSASTTIIITTANTGFISVTQTADTTRFEISRLRIYQNSATAVSSEECVACTNTNLGGDFGTQNFVSTDLMIADPGTGQTFSRLIALYGCYNSLITRAYLLFDTTYGSGSDGIYMGYNSSNIACITLIVRDCIFGGLTAAIRAVSYGSSGYNQQQTLQVFGCTALNCSYGVISDSMTQLTVQGCDFNCQVNLAATGTHGAIAQAQVVGNLFYSVVASNDCITGEWQDTTFTGNCFAALANSINCIHFTTGSGQNVVADNEGQTSGSSCNFLLIDSGATYIDGHGNNTRDSSFAAVYVDNDPGVTNRTGDVVGYTGTVTLTGGTATEDHVISIASANLGKQPNGAITQVQSDPTVGCFYYWQGASNSNTQITLRFFMYSGANLSAITYRYGILVGPNG